MSGIIDFATIPFDVVGIGFQSISTNAANWTNYGSSSTFNVRADQTIAISCSRAGGATTSSSGVLISGTGITTSYAEVDTAVESTSRGSTTIYIKADQDGTCTIQGIYIKASAGTVFHRWQALVMP